MTRYLIGIDAGATSTELLVTKKLKDENYSSKTQTKLFKPINFTLLGLEETSVRLSKIISKSVSRKILASTDYIVCGIAGARFEKDRMKLRKRISSIINYKKIHILPDVSIAFASVFNENDINCGILIAGTGSILYYRYDDGLMHRIGGWGRIAGDEGSGYWIGREALNSITQCYDGRQSSSLLINFVSKHYRITKNNLIKKIYNNNFDIPALCKLVFLCAEQGDLTSIQILKKAASYLTAHFRPLKKKKMRIALSGSLFQKEKLLEKYLKKDIRKSYPHIKFISTNNKPVTGAVKIAHKLSSINKIADE